MKLLASLTALVLLSVTGFGANWYVSPSGKSNNNGTSASPWSIQTAATNTLIQPGDTIWMLAGTYPSFNITINGTAQAPITLRPYGLQRTVVNGSAGSGGDYITHFGYEIYNSAAVNRTNSIEVLGPGLFLVGKGNKAINLTIHDVGAPGIWWPTTAGGDGTEVYGCVMWGIGLYQTDGGMNGGKRGPCLYMQNTNGTRRVENNVVTKSWTEGIKAYGQSISAEGFIITNNVTYLNDMDGILLETTNFGITNAWVNGNISFLDGYNRMGEGETPHQNLQLLNNWWIMQTTGLPSIEFYVHGWSNLDVRSNTWVNLGDFVDKSWAVFWQIWKTNSPTATFDYNRYFGGSEEHGNFYTNSTSRMTFATMRAQTGWDANGTFSTSYPEENTIYVTTNKYQAGRANITVLNWTGAETASVNLSGIGLQSTQPFEVRDTQNWLGTPIAVGTYNPSSPTITLSLTNTEVTPIMGSQVHMRRDPNVHTTSEFNSFVVLPGKIVTTIKHLTPRNMKGR